MTQFRQYMVALLVLLSIFFALFLFVSQNRLKEEQKIYNNFKNRSKNFVDLSRKWGENKNKKKIFVRLRAISRPIKDIKKGHIRILDFKNLSQLHLERIAKIIFNSNFNIQALDIEKVNDKISLHVEVKL